MTKECKKHLHITYMGGSNWVYPVWNAIRDAERGNRISKLSDALNKELGDIALAISIKLDILPLIVKRLNESIGPLYEEIKNRDKTKDKYAYEPKSMNKFLLLIDIDSYLFEIYSCFELLEVFTKKILRRVCRKVVTQKHYIKYQLEKESKSTYWLDKLTIDRGHFTHTGAPWLAICLDGEPKLLCKLLSSKR